MKKQYPYSHDTVFLSKIDNLQVQEQWVKITLLEYNSEIPLKSIEGKVTSGTLSKTGDSAVRRTCNLSCAIDTFKYNPEEVKADYSISKKIYLELGITNTTDDYSDEEIIWFPQGVFFITSFTFSASASGAATINLEFKDKMAKLDGTLGGVLPATVRFDTITSVIDGKVITKKALVYDIIMETVNHFGGEDLSNIIIDNIPSKAKRIIRWMGNEPVWIYPIENNGNISYDICFTSDLDEKRAAHTPVRDSSGNVIGAKEYKTNQDIGYMYEDFVYDEELTFNAGSKVTDVLDKIKNWLGNYEYFYDEQGQFHFQEIQNYLNNAQSSYMWDKLISETNDISYLYETTKGKAVYTFDDSTNLISITNTPLYENIKNDFIVEGEVTVNEIHHPCRYHLVIDDKPTMTAEGYDNILVYIDPVSENVTIGSPQIVEPGEPLPEFADDGQIYGILDESQTFTFKQAIKDMDSFAIYYNDLVNQENLLIAQDSLQDSIKQDLFDLLQRYMGYEDQTAYKDQYLDIIFTLARQLQRYNVSPKIVPLTATQEYYSSLITKFNEDIEDYGTTVQDRIAWCGCLLQLLYNLFNDIGDAPNNNYTDMSYWGAVNDIIPSLWDGIPATHSEQYLRNWQKAKCLDGITKIKMKQQELGVLIDQYGQIINNCDVQIRAYERKETLTTEEQNKKSQLILKKQYVQNQIDIYQQELSICEDRLNILYAILTQLGASSLGSGEAYYHVDVSIPVEVTSFWYYNTSNSEDGYGWNELEWYQYYNEDNSQTYIDYSKINWEDEDALNVAWGTPSMSYSSLWYQNYYLPYARIQNLPYFTGNQTYIPTNWRTELLLMGLRAEENGTDPGYYYQELKANWPTIYDFKKDTLSATSIDYIDYFVGKTGVMIGSAYEFGEITSGENADVNNSGTTQAQYKEKEAEIKNFIYNFENSHYYYFFDMIDSSSPTWGEYSVKNIGRRTNVNINNSVNCIFAPQIPNYAFINVSGLTWEERSEALTELKNVAEEVIQITDNFNKNFATGGLKQSAYEQIRYDLQQYTSYQNTVSITARPCFYLEPNTRVSLNDHSTNTYGEYVIKSISIPLGLNNTMSVSLSKAMEKI